MDENILRKSRSLYFRNFVFGVEDSLVSTVGLLSGIAVAGVAEKTILLTGFILIFVEAFSMAAGSFLSETSEEEYIEEKGKAFISSRPALAAGVMFLSYVIAGIIPLAPYAIASISLALPSSIAASLVALFGLGLLGGKLSRSNLLKDAFRMLLVGGTAIVIGGLVGSFLK